MLLLVMFTLTLPVDSPVMDYIDYLQLRGLVETPSIRPYDADWVLRQIDGLIINETRLNTTDRRVLSGLAPLTAKRDGFTYLLHLMGVYEREPLVYGGALDERVGGTLLPHLAFSHAMRIRRANVLDTTGPKPWNNFQTYLNEGLVRLQWDELRLDLGRRDIIWGPGATHSLTLSSAPSGYDGFLLAITGRYFEFHSVFSALDAARAKFLSLHRLGLDLKGFLKIGFSEALLSADSLEPSYLNPFFPFYLAQWSSGRDDNVMWSLDAQMRLLNSIFYGELLIDDYMYEDDPSPNKLAYQVGLRSLIGRGLVVHINYTFVDKWVYTQRLEQNVYSRRERCLGYPPGNDADEMSVKINYINASGLFPHLALRYLRKGEGTIYLPFEEEGGPTDPPFPSGVVDETLELKVGAGYLFRRNFHLRFDVGRQWRSNVDHVAGADADNWLIDLMLSVIL